MGESINNKQRNNMKQIYQMSYPELMEYCKRSGIPWDKINSELCEEYERKNGKVRLINVS